MTPRSGDRKAASLEALRDAHALVIADLRNDGDGMLAILLDLDHEALIGLAVTLTRMTGLIAGAYTNYRASETDGIVADVAEVFARMARQLNDDDDGLIG